MLATELEKELATEIETENYSVAKILRERWRQHIEWKIATKFSVSNYRRNNSIAK